MDLEQQRNFLVQRPGPSQHPRTHHQALFPVGVLQMVELTGSEAPFP